MAAIEVRSSEPFVLRFAMPVDDIPQSLTGRNFLFVVGSAQSTSYAISLDFALNGSSPASSPVLAVDFVISDDGLYATASIRDYQTQSLFQIFGSRVAAFAIIEKTDSGQITQGDGQLSMLPSLSTPSNNDPVTIDLPYADAIPSTSGLIVNQNGARGLSALDFLAGTNDPATGQPYIPAPTVEAMDARYAATGTASGSAAGAISGAIAGASAGTAAATPLVASAQASINTANLAIAGVFTMGRLYLTSSAGNTAVSNGDAFGVQGASGGSIIAQLWRKRSDGSGSDYQGVDLPSAKAVSDEAADRKKTTRYLAKGVGWYWLDQYGFVAASQIGPTFSTGRGIFTQEVVTNQITLGSTVLTVGARGLSLPTALIASKIGVKNVVNSGGPNEVLVDPYGFVNYSRKGSDRYFGGTTSFAALITSALTLNGTTIQSSPSDGIIISKAKLANKIVVSEIAGHPAREIWRDRFGFTKQEWYDGSTVIAGFHQADPVVVPTIDPKFMAYTDGTNVFLQIAHDDGTFDICTISDGAASVRGQPVIDPDFVRWIIDGGRITFDLKALTTFDATVARIIFMFISGQSNSVGAAQDLPRAQTLTPTNPGFSLMFNAGERVLGSDQGGTHFGELVTRAEIMNLVNAYEIPLMGETGHVRMAQKILSNEASGTGIITGTTGISGKSYYDWGQRSTVIYQNHLTILRRATFIAKLLQKPIIPTHMGLVAGEADAIYDYATVLANWTLYQSQMQADQRAIVGFNFDLTIVTWCTMGSATQVPWAQLQLAIQDPYHWQCTGAAYWIPRDPDGVHCSPLGQQYRGECYAEAVRRSKVYRAAIDGGNMSAVPSIPPHMVAAVRTGKFVKLTIAGIVGNIVSDTSWFTMPAQKGFLWQHTGAPNIAIVDVTITGAAELTIELASVPTIASTNPTIWAAGVGETYTPFRDSVAYCTAHDGVDMPAFICPQSIAVTT